MPRYTVELSFEYRATYTVEMPDDDPQGAMDAASAHDEQRHVGTALPDDFVEILVTLDEDRAYTDVLDQRVWDAQGHEIVFD